MPWQVVEAVQVAVAAVVMFALAKLPAEERATFTQLWADVAALLKKAEDKPK